MFLSEKNISEHSLEKLIGKRTKVDLKNPKTVGSTSLVLKSFRNKTERDQLLKTDSRCNFEKYSQGLLLRANFSNQLTAIPIPKTELNRIVLKRGKETIDPFFLSPMWILLKFGTPKLVARYFRVRLHEYSIEAMELSLDTKNYQMEFCANGYIFEGQRRFFESLGYGDKIKIID